MFRKILFAIIVVIFFSSINTHYVSAACGGAGKYCDVTFPCCTPDFYCKAVVNTTGGECTATTTTTVNPNAPTTTVNPNAPTATTKHSNVPVISDCINDGENCYQDNRPCCTAGYTCYASDPNNKATSACESPDNVKELESVHSTTTNPIGTPPCKLAGTAPDTYYACDTGFGFSIDTRPADFIKAMFTILLSISGGIALLLIIVSGYAMMVSRGNPEKIQAARERLTSAIIGLIFVIFSIIILQIIGVDILHLPGFSY